MSTAAKIAILPPTTQKRSALTPELKDFIDHAIVPLLVKEYLEENALAKDAGTPAESSQQHGSHFTGKVRP